MTDTTHDRLCNAVSACDVVEERLRSADDAIERAYGRLDVDDIAFLEIGARHLDISAQLHANARLRAYLIGRLTREEHEGDQRTTDRRTDLPPNPYATEHKLSTGQFFVREHMKPLHQAWDAGWKAGEPEAGALETAGGVPFSGGWA